MITNGTNINTYKNHVKNLEDEDVTPDAERLAKIIVNEILKKKEQLT